MNLSEFQWHFVEPEMHLRRGGPRGRLFARVTGSGNTWRAVNGLHLSRVDVRACTNESETIDLVESWLGLLLDQPSPTCRPRTT